MSKQVLRWMAGLTAATLLIAASGCGDDEPEVQAAKDSGEQGAGRGRDGGQPGEPDGESSGEPRQIAALIGSSKLTVRNQLSRIFDKLRLASRAELAAWVARQPPGED